MSYNERRSSVLMPKTLVTSTIVVHNYKLENHDKVITIGI